jgi:hypothetical protein
MTPLIFLVLGLALLAAAGWLRLGRTSGSRSWVGNQQTERTVLVTLPTVGAAVTAGAVMGLTHGAPTVDALAGGVVAVAVVALLLWGPLQLPLPRRGLPAWYRTRTAHRTRARRRSAGG